MSESFQREFCFSKCSKRQMKLRGKLSQWNPDLRTSEMSEDTPGRVSSEPTLTSVLLGAESHPQRGCMCHKRSIVSVEQQVTTVSNVRLGHMLTLIWLTDWLSDCILMAEIFHMCEIIRCLFLNDFIGNLFIL